MNTWQPIEVVELIAQARSASDVFGLDSSTPAGKRAGRRLHRALIAAVHPDRAAAAGLDRALAARAAAELNRLYDTWMTVDPDVQGPHVVGPRNSYALKERLWTTPGTVVHCTDDQQVRVEIARQVGGGAQPLGFLHDALAAQRMDAFVPEVLEAAITDGHQWTAYRLPAGMRSLREVHAAYPAGLDGRDWAWMARRILMTLAAANRTHGALTLDTVLIHPDQHGVMLTGWGPARRGGHLDGVAVADLFEIMLGASAAQQVSFARASERLSPSRRLHEYDLLLQRLYGERRFRRFALTDQTTATSTGTR
ncbi:hypothetical protein BH683_028230 [Williamsia sp. 1138]|uniref:hypothetical protein n=1 Tax=Williamsia sp. 1138 TaxID=1903117 RepID=UPI000A11A342|nr:hypothetical protein [Williamsia sp. 1138]OZG26009.1 hypothetical protein BH683_028230 [Williamsia sp. 1138]